MLHYAEDMLLMTPDASPRNAFTLRAMKPTDIPAAIALWNSAEGVSVAEGDSPEELEEYLHRNPLASHVALSGDELVGAVLAGHDGRRGFLYHLAVHPTQRGKGVGRELVEHSLKVLKMQNVKRVLILVAQDNVAGRSFWSRCGWEGMDFAAPMGIDL
jgi:ribosomal protein S18 acetylase RimI-like enzyme